MSLAAVAWPRMMCNGVWFDGKVSTRTIMDILLAKWDTKHREKGTPVTKPVTVNGERHKKDMVEEIIPSIMAIAPRLPGHLIFMKQHGAKLHVREGGHGGNPGCSKRWQSLDQPVNSPDPMPMILASSTPSNGLRRAWD
ncbi:unnamed protein product [Discosporangium mesarthrocarpum]